MSFVKVDRYYANLDYIALVEETDDVLVVRFHHTATNLPTTVSVKKNTGQAVDLKRALEAAIPH